ncbi:MAG: hypothetical protein GY943_34915, partial [Chloroflexi bacterium]|nr:hypothetical protein [Chloroflexota bacterium]
MNLEVAQYFDQIPALRNFNPEQFSVEKLSGFTNLNYRIMSDEHDWILRIPKPETNIYLDREQEIHNYNLAVELGFAPKPYWRNKTGMSLTATLRFSRTSNQQDLQSGE